MKHIPHLISIFLIALAALKCGTPALHADDTSLKLRMAQRIIENYYVDSVDTEKTVESAIVAMLKTLDPHSVYSNAEDTKDLVTPLEGNFTGIGIQFNMLDDTVFVIQTIPGGPCEKVGIAPGDRIIQAGDSVLAGRKLPNSRIMNVLRGPKGSVMPLTVVRRSEAEPLIFNVERDEIPIYSVDASFMADPTTGYIRITRFAESTDEEVAKALNSLRSQGMKNLIIDLQDNGGGYLKAATSVASHFLPKGAPIVYTDSPKLGRQDYDNPTKGDFTDGRLIVIVNQNSASASEILAGAIQDNDRGVIVGRRTFGKGLVQRPFNFPDGSMIRLTISRYHTPSGRCIQRPYDRDNIDDYSNDLAKRILDGELMSADSVHFDTAQQYATLRNGRTVYGGGGIMPDHFVAIDTTATTPLYRKMLAKGLVNRTAIAFVDRHRDSLKTAFPTEELFISSFTLPDAAYERLGDLARENDITFTAEELAETRPLAETILKGLIGRDLFDSSTYYKIVYPLLDNEYIAALELINDAERYQKLLRPVNNPAK